MLTHQRLALGQHDRFDMLAHELGVPALELRHLAAAQQLLAEILVRVHIELSIEIVLIEGVVARTVGVDVHQAALAEKLSPGVIAVTGQQGIVEIE